MSNAEHTTPKSTDLPATPRILIDADVLIAGSASTTGASHIILHLCGLTLLEGVIIEQVQAEAERNLLAKLPQGLPAFRLMIKETLTIMDDPSQEALIRFSGQAHPEDLPILVAAVLNNCHYLVTFNLRHYYPSGQTPATVLTPGDFIRRLRDVLGQLTPST